eukprot:5174846-Amphidinium_carterae.3
MLCKGLDKAGAEVKALQQSCCHMRIHHSSIDAAVIVAAGWENTQYCTRIFERRNCSQPWCPGRSVIAVPDPVGHCPACFSAECNSFHAHTTSAAQLLQVALSGIQTTRNLLSKGPRLEASPTPCFGEVTPMAGCILQQNLRVGHLPCGSIPLDLLKISFQPFSLKQYSSHNFFGTTQETLELMAKLLAELKKARTNMESDAGSLFIGHGSYHVMLRSLWVPSHFAKTGQGKLWNSKTEGNLQKHWEEHRKTLDKDCLQTREEQQEAKKRFVSEMLKKSKSKLSMLEESTQFQSRRAESEQLNWKQLIKHFGSRAAAKTHRVLVQYESVAYCHSHHERFPDASPPFVDVCPSTGQAVFLVVKKKAMAGNTHKTIEQAKDIRKQLSYPIL